jgi:integrase/recombinase XerC
MADVIDPSQSDDVDMIDSYCEYLRRASRTPVTIARRREVLTQLDRDLRRVHPLHGIGETNQDELEAWLFNEEWAANTRATYFSALRSAYRFWADPRDPWVDEDPTANMSPVPGVAGVARPVSEEQLAEILTRAQEPYRRWILIAAYQGLRCCELAGLDREHITVDILTVVRGKGGKPRVHDTDPSVWEAVKDLPPGPICRDRFGRGETTAQEICRRASHHLQHDLGYEGVTMHRFRHRLGVMIQRLYKDVRVTQEVLGHQTLAATMIYTRSTPEQQRAARAMLPRPPAG